MKNRTVIGILCMLLAVAITFLVSPLVMKLTTNTVSVPRLNTNIGKGIQITAENLDTVKVDKNSLPDNVITNDNEIIGKYAASALYAGDYLTDEKVSGDATSASNVFASLNGEKVAVSVTIDSFAAGLSGKLENGDIISLIIVDKESGKAEIPSELKYVKVITTTTAGGVEQDSVIKNDDGSYDIPSTVTVLVNTTQAKLLAEYEKDDTIEAALVFRGNAETANKFLESQDKFFETTAAEESTAEVNANG